MQGSSPSPVSPPSRRAATAVFSAALGRCRRPSGHSRAPSVLRRAADAARAQGTAAWRAPTLPTMIFPQMAAEPSSNLSSNVSRATNTKTEDWEFISDKSLNYICQMLMEKNIDEKVSIYQEIATLRSAAKPFYDILGHKFPPSPGHQMMPWSLDSPRP